MSAIKQQLYDYCQRYLAARIATAQQAIEDAQRAANEETKSSSGDKYETGRAMMQLEIEKNSVQLEAALKLKRIFDRIKIDQETKSIQPGSLVITDQGNFFIAISVGEVVIENISYIVVSPESPLGSKMIGKHAGTSFAIGNTTRMIERVC